VNVRTKDGIGRRRRRRRRIRKKNCRSWCHGYNSRNNNIMTASRLYSRFPVPRCAPLTPPSRVDLMKIACIPSGKMYSSHTFFCILKLQQVISSRGFCRWTHRHFPPYAFRTDFDARSKTHVFVNCKSGAHFPPKNFANAVRSNSRRYITHTERCSRTYWYTVHDQLANSAIVPR
jgi:hypothetical protein